MCIRDREREWESGSGETIRMIQQGCRTVAINHAPFCLASRVNELRGAGVRNFRADFINRKYDPVTVRDLWRAIRLGRHIAGHEGNYKRGIQ